ncbi:MAG: hypothetical protein IJU26_03510 [Synergistaceae bacterium]|nr:hypothetical protein [Synergistaceae bacterium]
MKGFAEVMKRKCVSAFFAVNGFAVRFIAVKDLAVMAIAVNSFAVKDLAVMAIAVNSFAVKDLAVKGLMIPAVISILMIREAVCE